MEQKCYLSATIGVTICIILLDLIWLGLIQKNNWNDQVYAIQGSKLIFRMLPAIITYAVMVIVILSLAVSRTKKQTLLRDSLVYGFFVGFAMYGVFNGTNYSIFKDYKITTALTDTLWGVFLSIISTIVGGYLSEHVKIYKLFDTIKS